MYFNKTQEYCCYSVASCLNLNGVYMGQEKKNKLLIRNNVVEL